MKMETKYTGTQVCITMPIDEWNAVLAGINNSVPYRQINGQNVEKNNQASCKAFEAAILFRDAVQREVWADQLKPAIARNSLRT